MFAASKTSTATSGYQISRSLRFNSADSAYLNRTPASAGNRRKWTWSAWVKRSGTGDQKIFSGGTGTGSTDYIQLFFGGTTDSLRVSTYVADLINTTSVYRDYSAWYHIVWVADTDNATATNRMQLYVNNTLVATANVTGDLGINQTQQHSIGYNNYGAYGNFYMTEVNFIDGQALTPSSFGETNAQTGVWQPKAYSGSYGTNGFYLNFSDNSNTTAATLGKDYSGNGNNWTPNNFSVTAGAGNDSLVDSPTSYGTDTGVGGTVRGNYATWNAVGSSSYATLSNGNLNGFGNTAADNGCLLSTIGVTSGKWYWEETIGTVVTSYPRIGAMFAPATNGTYPGRVNGVGYVANGNIERNGSSVTTVASFTTGDVIGMALDLDNLTIAFYKNNTLQYTATALTAGTYFLGAGQYNGSTSSVNFGQRPFAYTAPSGFKALCTQNLPTPTIGATTATTADKYFGIVLRNGTGSSGGTFSTTVNMANGAMWWEKPRNFAGQNQLVDSVRGLSKYLSSNTTVAEGTDALYVTAFGANSFTMGSDDWPTNRTIVDWMWAANGSGSTNTAGSITSTVSANATSGFSIITWTGNATQNATIGHGLGAKPTFFVVKNRTTGTSYWPVKFKTFSTSQYIYLNDSGAVASFGFFYPTEPTSSVIYLGSDADVNGNGNSMVCYAFTEIAGYSAMGSYTGNGSTDGPFIYTGFKPAYLLIKNISSAGQYWDIYDNKRNTYNPETLRLFPNASDAEGSATQFDFLSNGFKVISSSTSSNGNGNSIIYMAFAESPFKYSLAR